jgi:phosphohistidine phosphatase SixA
MTHKLALAVIAIGFLSACAPGPGSVDRGGKSSPTTILLLLHAETNPVYMDRLSARGLARAAALPDAIAGYRISTIYFSSFRRNYQTIKPLADRLDLVPRPMPVHRKFYGVYEARQLGEKLLAEHRGETILWVGTSLSVKALYEGLEGPSHPPRGPGELVALTVTETGSVAEAHLRFGD